MKSITVMLAILVVAIENSNAQNVGIGTNQPKALLHVADSSVVFAGNNSLPLSPANPPINGPGKRLMWYSDKAAFRTGFVSGPQWDKDSIGQASIAMGYSPQAKGFGSISLGTLSIANGVGSVALGNGQAEEGYSIAIGYSSKAKKPNSIALGNYCYANGDYSLVAGGYSSANGISSISIGSGVISKAIGSIALGMHNDTSDMPLPIDLSPTDRLFQVGNGTFSMTSNALTILRNGNTGIGALNPQAFLHIKGNSYPTPSLLLEETENDFARLQFRNVTQGRFWEIGAKPSTTNSAASFEIWHAGGLNNIFTIRGDGNATLLGSLTQASDARLKKNVQQLSPVLQKIDQLKAYTYQWNNEAMDQQQQIGLLAQEVEKVFPMLVRTDDKGTKSVNYISLIPVLLSAIQELQQRVNILENKETDKKQ